MIKLAVCFHLNIVIGMVTLLLLLRFLWRCVIQCVGVSMD